MKKIIFIIVVLQLFNFPSFGQKEINNWFFGNYLGMDFNNVHTVTNAEINGVANQQLSDIPNFQVGPFLTYEGCFAISDAQGKTLFTSDGRTVHYQKSDGTWQTMPHGVNLKGSSSSSQSGIVVPNPANPNRYYIFTISCNECTNAGHNGRNGINYYEVDMTLNNGYGDVVSSGGQALATKLVVPGYTDNQTFENIGAMGHANGKDYWLVHRTRGHIFVWAITEEGVVPTPQSFIVTYNPGVTILDPGYTKFSPNGKYIVTTAASNHMVSLGKFDNATGIISNLKTVSYPSGQIYSATFSAKNKYIYVTRYYKGPVTRFNVEDFLNGTSTTPAGNNEEHVSNNVTNVQLGPDNRIYGIASASATNGSGTAFGRYLYVILDPDAPTVAEAEVAIIKDYFPVGGNPYLSFPTFTMSFFTIPTIEMNPPNACVDKESEFSAQVNPGSGEGAVTRLLWDFGDGTPPIVDTDMSNTHHAHKHTYKKAGKYTFRLIPYQSGGMELTDKVKELEIHVGSCGIPVNHNITNMRY